MSCNIVSELRLVDIILFGFHLFRKTFNLAKVDTSLHESVTCNTPAVAPWIADNPVIFSAHATIANSYDTVVNLAFAIFSGVNSFPKLQCKKNI